MNIIEKTGTKLADRDIEFIEREISARLNKGRIIRHLEKSGDKEQTKIADFLKKNSITVFPYEFTKKYRIDDVSAGTDEKSGLIFIEDNGQKIFMKRSYTSMFRAKRYYKNILLEQDPQSPHRYVTDSFRPEKDNVIIDIGGAEGFFGLPYIDIIKKLYIFECDPGWIEALKLTYKDHLDKVCIIPKFVSNITDDTHISLDDFIKEHELKDESVFMKIDAEGSEPLITEGASKWLSENPKIKLALCVYHSEGQEKYFRDLFKDRNIENSDGYMIYYYDYNFKAPYIRRGVLRIS